VKIPTTLLLACLPGVVEAAAYQGKTVEQALEQLRADGIPLFYSSDLVKPWMRIQREPAASEPRALLVEILAPHGITVTDGPDGALILVREAQRSPRQAAPGAPRRPAPTPLDTVIVSASSYVLGGDALQSSTVLNAGDLEMLPEIGEDPIRAVARLPGVARQDFSSRVHLRGGTYDETLVRFDDLRLYDPFHFKDFYGIFSAIDPGIVSDIRVYTGGFPVTFGDRSSGVVEVSPRLPERQFHGQAEFSLFTAGVSGNGSYDDGAGDWALAARRSNLGLFFDLTNQSLGEPDYHDLYAHVGRRISDQLAISANALAFVDQIVASDTDQEEIARAEYRDVYYWTRLDLGGPDGLGGRVLVARTELSADRSGTTNLPGIAAGSLEDERDFIINSIQADGWWRPGARSVLQAGAEWRQLTGHYRYTDQADFGMLFLTPGAPTESSRQRSVVADPSGHQAGVYVNWRYEPTRKLTTDLGMRWDRETLAEQDGSQTSPRAMLMWRPRDDTRLRLSWGRYFQAQGINELPASDGERNFSPSQRATHLVGSIEHDLSPALKLRAEGYRKDYRHPLPRYELLMNALVVLPELRPDRIRIAPDSSRAEGIELSLNYDAGPLSAWLSYSASKVFDRVDGENFRRRWDQRNYASGGLNWRGARWEASVAATWHTGWRTTMIELETLDPFPLVSVGKRNDLHLADFASIDLRVARRFDLGSAGELTAFVEVNNVARRTNQCCVDYQLETDLDPATLDVEILDSLPLIPSAGFVWKF
jgi:TonB dependent receptor-like, beta-barrel/TonB-dependent Receptor Plug Domain